MFENALPAIPYSVTAVAQCLSAVVMVLGLRRHAGKLRINAAVVLGSTVLFGVNLLLLSSMVPVTNIRSLLPANFLSGWTIALSLCALSMILYIRALGFANWRTAISCGSIAFSFAELAAAAEWYVSGVLTQSPTIIAPAPMMLLVIFYFGYFSLMWFVENRQRLVTISYDKGQAILCLLIEILAVIASNVAFFHYSWTNRPDLTEICSMTRIVASFAGVITLVLFQENCRSRNAQMELNAAERLMELQYQQYREFRDSNEYISRQCHDLKHQIDALRKDCSPEERERYLSELETMMQTIQIQHNTGSSVLDTILTKKQMVCEKNEIQFSCQADGHSVRFMSARALSILLGNIIDNAIECVAAYPDSEDRIIQGSIYRKMDFLMIDFCNCCLLPPEAKDGVLVTTKADKIHHGYGLSSIAIVTEDYGGTVQYGYENGWFRIQVLLPIPEEQKESVK